MDYSQYTTVAMQEENLAALEAATIAGVEAFFMDPTTDPSINGWLVKTLNIGDPLSTNLTSTLRDFVIAHLGYIVLRPNLLQYGGALAGLKQIDITVEIKNHIVACVKGLRAAGVL